MGSSPVQQSPSCSSSVCLESLPTDVLELLTSLNVSSEQIAEVEQIYNRVGRAHQEAEVLKCGFNHGTAKAISWLMKNAVN